MRSLKIVWEYLKSSLESIKTPLEYILCLYVIYESLEKFFGIKYGVILVIIGVLYIFALCYVSYKCVRYKADIEFLLSEYDVKEFKPDKLNAYIGNILKRLKSIDQKLLKDFGTNDYTKDGKKELERKHNKIKRNLK